MRSLLLALFAALFSPAPAHADTVNTALSAAIAAFEEARPGLGRETFGVDIKAYGDALKTGHFRSPLWGRPVALDIVMASDAEAACSRYAAFMRIPPQNDRVTLAICPEFVAAGTDSLRRLTILHELVHAVSGPDECRAMAFAARIEHLAFGAHTPVDRYWQANNCAGSGFALP